MSRARYFRRVLIVGGLLVTSQVLLVALPAAPRATSCAELRRWATERYEGARPFLADMAALDRRHRIAAFNVIAPEVRASLWREQLHRFGQRSDLSPLQRAIVREARELVTPAFYAHEATAMQAFDRFWPRVEAAFRTREHRRAWVDLGAGTVAAERAASGLWDQVTRRVRVNAQYPPCECSTRQYWEECLSWNCVSATYPDLCEFWVGCGPLSNQWCNGVCL